MINNKNKHLIVNKNVDVEKAMENNIFPYYIKKEYSRLYELASANRHYGVWMEMKDLIEVVIKLPVLLGISYIIQRDENNDELQKILDVILTTNLTLGDWKKVTNILLKSPSIVNELPDIHGILNCVLVFIKEYKTIEWRNDMIGHGALPFEDSEEFLSEITKQTKGIDECLENSICNYSKINIDFESEQLVYVEIGDKQVIIDKCIFKTMFFFDKYDVNTSKVFALDYINAKRVSVNVQWYNDRIRNMYTEEIIERMRDSIKKWSFGSILRHQKINLVNSYQNNKILIDWLNKCLNCKKGVFLLTMDRGMGKTAFVSSINPMVMGKDILTECFTRVYYCNSLKYDSMRDFSTMFNALLVAAPNPQDIDLHTMSKLQANSSSVDLTNCLKEKLDFLAEDNSIYNKILLIIDGIDEIYHSDTEKNIFDYIPIRDDVPEGVFILLTSRNGETEALSEYTKQKLNFLRQNSITDEFDFSITKKECKEKYIYMLKKYYKKILTNYYKDESAEFNNIFGEVCELSQYRFVDFKLYVSLIREAAVRGQDINTIITNKGIFSDYFKYIKSVRGEKQYKKSGRLLLIVATSYNRLLIEDCAFLESLYEYNDNLEMVMFLHIFEGIIKYGSMSVSEKNNASYISLANERYRDVIIEEFGCYMDELISEWLDFIDEQYNNVYLKQENSYLETDYTYPKTYLHAYITKYILDNPYSGYNNEIHKNRIMDVNMVNKIYQYELFLPTNTLGIRYREPDIEMSESCIRLLINNDEYMTFSSSISYKNQLLLPGAYNSYIFHRKDIYKEAWGNNCPNSKAIKDKDEILSICDKGIERINDFKKLCKENNIDDYKLQILELHSKLVSGKGAFLYILNDMPDEMEQLFYISYQLTYEILVNNIVRGAELLTQSAERVVTSIAKTGNVKLLNEIYESYIKEIENLKKNKNISHLLKKNSMGRVEYGILPREAMLYRKIATVGDKLNWNSDDGIRSMYQDSLNKLNELCTDKDYSENQISVLKDYKRVVYVDFGRFERKYGNYDRAINYFEEACLISERLIEKSKKNIDVFLIKSYIDYMELCNNLNVHNELYTRLYNRVRDWMTETPYCDKALKDRFNRLTLPEH